MTREDYKRLAVIVATIRPMKERKRVGYLLANDCKADNPRFDRARFYTACGIETGIASLGDILKDEN